mmetsp:Transcript_29216/g.86497  ORF Transcript_29216/g.86497 Transcript_29216/m.86497 type:complete len:211 (-) Transcript_29216:1347-1979(-)
MPPRHPPKRRCHRGSVTRADDLRGSAAGCHGFPSHFEGNSSFSCGSCLTHFPPNPSSAEARISQGPRHFHCFSESSLRSFHLNSSLLSHFPILELIALRSSALRNFSHMAPIPHVTQDETESSLAVKMCYADSPSSSAGGAAKKFDGENILSEKMHEEKLETNFSGRATHYTKNKQRLDNAKQRTTKTTTYIGAIIFPPPFHIATKQHRE